MNNSREGLLSVHAAVFIFGLTALFSKIPGLDAAEITFVRSIFAALAIVVYIKAIKESFSLKHKNDIFITIVLSALLLAHWVTYFHAMQVSTVAVGIISLYTFPVITVFLEPFFYKERIHIKDIVSALIVLLGIYFLVPEFKLDNQTTLGVLWGVFSAFLFALRNILQGRYYKAYPARQALLYQTAIIVVLLMPLSGGVVSHLTQSQWLLLLLLGIAFTALPHTLFANALLHLKAKSVSLIACMQVVYGTFFAFLILNEIPSWTTIVGGIMVVSAAVYETLSHSKKS